MTLGSLSAATLGFIVGDVPGAVIGYKGYNALTRKQMKHSRKSSGSTTSRKRTRYGTSSTGVMKNRTKYIRSKKPYRKHAPKTVHHSLGLRAPMMSLKHKKTLKQARGLKVRFTKKFAKKVKKVLHGNSPQAFTIHTFFDWYNGQQSLNTQGIAQVPSEMGVLGWNQAGTAKTVFGLLFTPSWFLQQASLAWNGLPMPNYDGTTWQSGNAVDISNGSMLPWRNTKFPVIKSWARYCLRNNSQRTLYVNCYNCKPKFKAPIVNTQGNTQVAFDDWIQSVEQSSYTEAGTEAYTTTSYINAGLIEQPWDTSVTTYKEDPRHNRWWSSRWSCEVTKLKLEPGQCTPYIVKGPSDLELDYMKFGAAAADSATAPQRVFDCANFQDIQPFTRSTFFTYHHEMTSYSVSGGQWRNGIPPAAEMTADGEGFLIECSIYSKIGMPDVILRKQEAAYQAGTILANNRVDKYGNFVYAWLGTPDAGGTLIVNNAGVSKTVSG